MTPLQISPLVAKHLGKTDEEVEYRLLEIACRVSGLSDERYARLQALRLIYERDPIEIEIAA